MCRMVVMVNELEFDQLKWLYEALNKASRLPTVVELTITGSEDYA